MIRQVYRLTGERQIEVCHISTKIDGDVLVRPKYLAICAADQRYYTGNRDPEVMRKKLPMSLIHEACGVVLYDRRNIFSKGDTVVFVPTIPNADDKRVRENYQAASRFRSSGCDGFMQSVVPIPSDRLIKVRPEYLKISVLSELLSVAVGSVRSFLRHTKPQSGDVIGVWGDGSVGFTVCLALKALCPDLRIAVFGKNMAKLQCFSFADTNYKGNIHYAFECVGGNHSGEAIAEIIDIIEPQGVISLLGVSEQSIPINTRKLLEKGLTVLGHSRSSKDDFIESVKIMESNDRICGYLASIISEELEINSISDIHYAFERDRNNDFKTVLKWNM